MNYSKFQRPSRYINSEKHSIRKSRAEVKTALAFPDIYDVGMSHLGLKILYKIINDLPFASAERLFHPWIDLEAEMKRSGLPLVSLESQTRAEDFDIIGFSLQYELAYTSVLNMLSLGNIPIRSNERSDKDPIIMAGGPCTVNPLPMSPFIDAFFLGDAEDAIVEILDTFRRFKASGDGHRETIIRELSKIEGVYAPSFNKSVKRRFISNLDDAPYPTSPIIPYTAIIHDRVNIEVSRGCTMGCRFCQAGMIYRPMRERSAQNALKLAEESIRSTGYEEVSFTSLSAGDYTHLLPLMKAFNKRFEGKNISVSLPSLRVKAVNEEILKEIKSVRKTGFTIAPEAASQRLRGVINKDFEEEDYERTLNLLFKEGWLNLKLYYMIGLPTETDEDVHSIVGMVKKAIKSAKKYTSKFVNINVSVSPYVPKPHTPFQWVGQIGMDEIRRKKEHIRRSLKGINVKGHDERMSMLEGCFSRGDESLAPLIESAHNLGLRLDGWSETFDFGLWQKAMDDAGIDSQAYAKRDLPLDEPLQWDFIDTGVSKSFLKKEYETALSCAMTPNCKQKCSACGLKCDLDAKADAVDISSSFSPPSLSPLARAVKLRVRFSKTGTLRYLSHRELMNVFIRAINRAEIKLDYTKGFHPSPKLAFGPPLNVGVSGLGEYADIEVLAYYNLEELRKTLNNELPDGVSIEEIKGLFTGESLQSFVTRYEYEIIFPEGVDLDSAVAKTERPLTVQEIRKISERSIAMTLIDSHGKKVKLDEILTEIFGVRLEDVEAVRTRLTGQKNGEWTTPDE